MTLAGWFLMIASVGGVTIFFCWCILRVLRAPAKAETLHAPPNIKTADEEEP